MSRGIPRLLSLRQGSHSVAVFAIEFRTLAAESGWNDEALQGVFLNALDDVVKNELVSREDPTGLDQLIALAIRVDNWLHERHRERTFQPPPSSISLPPAASRSQPPSPFYSCRGPLSPSEPEPMQLGRTRLSPEERERRMLTTACLYCSQSGHFVSVCPTRPGNERPHQ